MYELVQVVHIRTSHSPFATSASVSSARACFMDLRLSDPAWPCSYS